jgi:hypothetical protein
MMKCRLQFAQIAIITDHSFLVLVLVLVLVDHIETDLSPQNGLIGFISKIARETFGKVVNHRKFHLRVLINKLVGATKNKLRTKTNLSQQEQTS